MGGASRVWFTLSHGIFNEIYYPRVDLACVRDMGLVVTDGSGLFSEEKRHADSQVSYPSVGVPMFRLVNNCKQGLYSIEKDILSDPGRSVVLQGTRFIPLRGGLRDYRLHVVLAPHLGNRGGGNTAWVGDHGGIPLLFAARDGVALALASSAPWLNRSAGFVGVSDGWQDLSRHKRMNWSYVRAENGNVALTAEIDMLPSKGSFVLALGFGATPEQAADLAIESLGEGLEAARQGYVDQWRKWQDSLALEVDGGEAEASGLCRMSAAVIRCHEDKAFPGGMIASLSIPWGFNRGDDDLGGYHLAWPRDLVESAGGLLAAGARDDVRRAVYYLEARQAEDGHWPQNMWLDGTPYWNGIQMDETAFPVLLVDLCRREKALEEEDLDRLWPMVRRAAAYIARNGPVTQEDRWEEDAGYSPFTLAVETAALLVASDMAELNGEGDVASYLRETADAWNEGIDRWVYAAGTDLARETGVEGYYVRIAPPERTEAASPAGGFVPIKNRPAGKGLEPAVHIISPDALALVRFGLRAADDPRIVNTLRVIDRLLKAETPYGPAWHRYNDDGYGEHDDGSPFDGTGRGRLWPLLTGERAHYELAAGRPEEARGLMRAMAAFANPGAMLSEQVWDSADIPERELFFGRPSGSAMPLVWAHAEFIKLLRSLRDGKVFDTPPQTLERYVQAKAACPFAFWRFNHKCSAMPAGRKLRVETLAAATVRWSGDNWGTAADADTRDTGLGLHVADLAADRLDAGSAVRFTFYWKEAGKWEGQDFEVRVT